MERKFLSVLLLLLLCLFDLGLCCRCGPPRPGEEVCGEDGQTYQSECMAFCLGGVVSFF